MSKVGYTFNIIVYVVVMTAIIIFAAHNDIQRINEEEQVTNQVTDSSGDCIGGDR